MNRRKFLTSSLATSAVALASGATAQTPASSAREYYHIRRYILESGPQSKLTESYFGDALIPTLTRMGMGPVGAFRLELGQDTPMLYLLIPGSSITALAELDLNLAKDEDFLKAAAPFWNATAAAPPFIHVETSLTRAFEGWPKLVTPPSTAATKSKRIFQLRTYMSPSNGDHVRKVEMFHSGEFEIFKRTGCNPGVFQRCVVWAADALPDVHAEL